MAKRTIVDREVDQKETHRFNPTLDVVARPVDTYQRNSGLSDKASRLASALGVAVQGAGAVGQLLGQQNQAAREEGQRLADTPGAVPPQESDNPFSTANIVRGVMYKAQGGRDAVDARAELTRAANAALTFEDYQTAKAKIEDRYSGAFQDSAEYLSSFSEPFRTTAASLETALHAKFLEQSRTKVLDDRTVQLNQYVSDNLQAFTLPNGLVDEQALLEASPGLATKFRAELTNLQGELAKIGMSKAKVSEWYLKNLRGAAIAKGSPEILQVAYEPDADGVTLASRFPEIVNGAQAAAVAARATKERLAKDKAKENAERQESAFQTQVFELTVASAELFSQGDPSDDDLQALQDQWQSLMKSPLATEVSGSNLALTAKATTAFSSLSQVLLKGTPESAFRVQRAINEGDVDFLRDVASNPQEWGWDNVLAATKEVTDQTKVRDLEKRRSGRNLVMLEGEDLFRSTVQTALDVEVMNANRIMSKLNLTVPETSEFSFSMETPTEIAQRDLAYVFQAGLKTSIDRMYDQHVNTHDGVPPTPSEAEAIHKIALEQAQKQAKAITDQYKAEVQSVVEALQEKKKAALGVPPDRTTQAITDDPTQVTLPDDFETGLNPIGAILPVRGFRAVLDKFRDSYRGVLESQRADTAREIDRLNKPGAELPSNESVLEAFDRRMQFLSDLTLAEENDSKTVTKEHIAAIVGDLDEATKASTDGAMSPSEILDTIIKTITAGANNGRVKLNESKE